MKFIRTCPREGLSFAHVHTRLIQYKRFLMENILTQSFFLSAGETNPEQEMSVPVLVSKIIDVATLHANSLGIGNPAMVGLRAGWVLSRLSLEINRWPAVNETYSLSTWIESFNRHFSERAFALCDNEGRVLGHARSVWMVMGVDSHENVGLSHLSLPEDMIRGERVPIARQKRHQLILPIDADPLPAGALRADRPTSYYTFKYTDLDSYRHVNTVRYVELLLNQFSLEDFDSDSVRRLELSFLHEARYGMKTGIYRLDSRESGVLADGSEAAVSSFSLVDASDSSPFLYARICLAPRDGV